MWCGVWCRYIVHVFFMQVFCRIFIRPDLSQKKEGITSKGKYIFYVRFARNLQLATAQHPKNICSIGAILKVRDLIGIRHCASYSNSKPLRPYRRQSEEIPLIDFKMHTLSRAAPTLARTAQRSARIGAVRNMGANHVSVINCLRDVC